MPKDNKYSLEKTKSYFLSFLKLLSEEDLLENYTESMPYTWIGPSGHPGSGRKFHVNISKENPLRFVPKPIDEMLISAEISTKCIRRGKGRLGVDEHFVLIRLSDRSANGCRRVVCRVHFDLANVDQPGPWSHLQIGGRSVDQSENWSLPPQIGELRLPAPLYNVILACELVVYSFWHDKWCALCAKHEFLAPIQWSEDSYFQPFYEQWNDYLRLDNRRRTFMCQLCNKQNAHPWRS